MQETCRPQGRYEEHSRYDHPASQGAADVIDTIIAASRRLTPGVSARTQLAFMMRRLLAILRREADIELALHEGSEAGREDCAARRVNFLGAGPSYDVGEAEPTLPTLPTLPPDLGERHSCACSLLREMGISGIGEKLRTPYTVIFSEDMLDEAAMENFHHRQLAPRGCIDVMVSYWLCSPQRLVSLSVYRQQDQRPFGESDRATLSLMLRAVAPIMERTNSGESDTGESLGDASAKRILQMPPRRRAVLGCLLRGLSEKEAGQELGVSVHTIHSHVKALYTVYGVESRGELMACFIDRRIRQLSI